MAAFESGIAGLRRRLENHRRSTEKATRTNLGWHRRSGLFVTRNGGNTWQMVNPTASLNSAWVPAGRKYNRNRHRSSQLQTPRLLQRHGHLSDHGRRQDLDQVATDLVRPPSEDHAAVWRGRGCEILCAGGPQALAVDPTNPKTLYFGYWDTQAWKSDDGGLTCYRMTSGIPRNWGRMGAVVLDPDNPDILWMSVGENRGNQQIYQSVNAGRDFHLVGHAGSGLPPGAIFSIIVDPTSPPDRRTLYAAVTEHGVFKSEDGGMSLARPVQRTSGRQPNATLNWPWTPTTRNGCSSPPPPIPIRESHSDARLSRPNCQRRKRLGSCSRRRSNHSASSSIHSTPRRSMPENRNFSGVDYPNAFYTVLSMAAIPGSPSTRPQFLAGPGSHEGDKRCSRLHLAGLAADHLHPGALVLPLRHLQGRKTTMSVTVAVSFGPSTGEKPGSRFPRSA